MPRLVFRILRAYQSSVVNTQSQYTIMFEIRVLIKHYWEQDYKAAAAYRRKCKMKVKVSLVSVWHNDRSKVSTLEKKTPKIYHVLENLIMVYWEYMQSFERKSAKETRPTRRLSEELRASKDTIHRQIKKLGKSYTSCRPAPHELIGPTSTDST